MVRLKGPVRGLWFGDIAWGAGVGPATQCDEIDHFAAILRVLEASQPISGRMEHTNAGVLLCSIAVCGPGYKVQLAGGRVGVLGEGGIEL